MTPLPRHLPRLALRNARNGDLLPCSVVIPTRGRCPEPPGRLRFNPLCQCLDSLLHQRRLPRQIVIASAVAGDHTNQALEYYRRTFAARKVDFGVLWLPDEDRLGPFGKIAQALDVLKSDLVHMVEDDVFLHPDALAGAFELMQRLRRACPRLALLSLPLYRRATRPTKLLPYSQIGQVDHRLRLTGCFESVFPRELCESPGPSTYPKTDGLLCHSIDFFRGGNNVITREALAVLQHIRLGTPYGWEVCAGLHLKQRGFELRYSPYTNLAGAHSFYGADWGRRRLLGEDWTETLRGYTGLSLAAIVRHAAARRSRSGLGPLPLPIYYFRVATCYALILRRYRPRLVPLWIRKLQAGFVEGLKTDITAGRQRLGDRAVRESIFLAALHAIEQNTAWLSETQAMDRVQAFLSMDARDRRAQTAGALRRLGGNGLSALARSVPNVSGPGRRHV